MTSRLFLSNIQLRVLFACVLLPGIALCPVVVSAEDPIQQDAIEEAAQKAVEQSVDEAAAEAMEKTVKQAAEKAAQQAVEQTVDTAAEKAAQKAVEKTVGEAAQKAVEKSVGKAAEKAVQKAVEKAVSQTVEQAAQKAAAEEEIKARLTARRPEEWKGPTKIHFLVFVVDIDAIDDADQSFSANVYIRLRWHDPRLARPDTAVRQMPLESAWNPRVLIVNQTGQETKSLPEVVQVDEDGNVTYYQRYTGQLSQPLNLYRFPMDSHTFVVQFVAAGYRDDDIEFIPDTDPSAPDQSGGSIADSLSVPDWEVVSHEALRMTYQPIKSVHAAGFGMRFEARRYITYYLWQVVLPLAVVVIMAWSAFWVGREHVGVRIGIATSAILTMIANRFVLASLLPRLPYMTRMDYLSVGSTLLVLLALFLVIATAILDIQKRDRLSLRLDRWGRVVYPVLFLSLLGWFLLA